MRKTATGFRRPEDMEDEVPDVYLRWLNTPADWLEGCTPGEYFDRFSDSAQLCALLCGYIREGVPVPDPLLDRLAELGDEAALMALAKDKSCPLRGAHGRHRAAEADRQHAAHGGFYSLAGGA